jgi:hypothetical protein
MNCEKVRELLFDLIDGELSENTANEIRAHLDVCEECKKEYNDLLGMTEAIKESALEAPAELHSMIMSGVEAEKKRVRRARLMRNLTAIGGCAAAFVIVINVWFRLKDKAVDKAPGQNSGENSPSISIKADNVFNSVGSSESNDDVSVELSASSFEHFVGEWHTRLKDGTEVVLIIGEDRSAVVGITDKNGLAIYYDGTIEFKNGTVTISQSDGNKYFKAVIKAAINENKLYFDIVSGETPWGEAT